MSMLPVVGAGGAIAWAAPALAPVAPRVAAGLGVPLRTDDDASVALTFDDGPHPLGTPAVLDVLDAHDARATFFLVGEQVRRSPHLAREILARGHAIGVHGYRHRNLLRVPPSATDRDFDLAAAAITSAVGACPRVHRPPYGIYSAGALRAVRRRGWTPWLWSRWGRDWAASATPSSIAQLVAADALPGDVLLLHDSDDYSSPGSWRATVAALPIALAALAERRLGTSLVPGALGS